MTINLNIFACIAYIAAKSTVFKEGILYDYQQGKHMYISGDVNSNFINIKHEESDTQLYGVPSDLYETKSGAHIALIMTDNKFTGFDYSTGCHFSGSLGDRTVSIADHRANRHLHYRF